jgi:restriction system protein
MARRRRQGTAEGILEIVAALPWWAGLLLALFSFIVLHWLGNRQQPVFTNTHQVAGALPFMMFSSLGRALQFVIPPLCVLAAVASFVRRNRRTELVANVTQSASAESLNGMSWREFKTLVGEAFRLQGYEVQEQGGARPDGGVDLVLRRSRETFLVQCKQWKAMKVGVDVVRELYGVMAARGAAGGFVVTSGRFTDDATAFATGRNVRLVDGARLFGLLQQAKSSASAGGRPAVPANVAPDVRAGSPEVPACPKCSAPMVLRMAKQGNHAGSHFWGCTAFPACRGTR